MSTQHSPLYHQWTCGVVPIAGRTIIKKAQAAKMVGSLHVPGAYRGASQEDWEAEVVANAATGGWRMGVLQDKAMDQYGHLMERPPESLTKADRSLKIWKIAPYFVEAPEVPVGSKVICCWLSGQPFQSNNGYDYYLTDGEHAYKAVMIPPAVRPPVAEPAPDSPELALS